MKIGDIFRGGVCDYEWRFVYDIENNVVRTQAVPSGELYGPGASVENDLKITEEEFCAIQKVPSAKGWFYSETNLPLFPEETYRYGDVFEIISYPHHDESVGQKLMLCQVGYGKYCLVTVDGFARGNRWSDPVEPKDNMAITKEELRQMCGSAQSVVLKKVNE